MASVPSPARLLIVGLDCLAPGLVFERWRERLPTFARLMEEGSFGPLRSCDPPITIPAWSCMFSGRDPGELGLYGFGHRQGWGPGEVGLPDAGTVRAPRLWELASQAGRESIVVGVPQTWPPPAPGRHRGRLVSGILCPGRDVPCTSPPALVDELPEDYAFDLEGFRARAPDEVERAVHAMTDARFGLFTRWLREPAWALAVIVEIGVDRMHHVFWGEGEARIERYYRRLDEHLAACLDAAGPRSAVMVVSDHGAQRLEGAVRINEWLRREGLLSFDEAGRPDWRRSRAVGQGGYCGRILLNLRGRQPGGLVAPEEADALLERIEVGLKAITGPSGEPARTRVLRPRELYRALEGHPPDLLVYFDDLRWRALGTPGDSVWTAGNDAGPDGANHHPDGVYLARHPSLPGRGRLEGLVIQDVFATAMAALGLDPPGGTLGTSRW
ncbi:MAG: alkaline phosphatase family protein [Deltaproteobacteria bacterium]|nr:alkaline phosphatase family protein [Deltaproteobacteria bacterium]